VLVNVLVTVPEPDGLGFLATDGNGHGHGHVARAVSARRASAEVVGLRCHGGRRARGASLPRHSFRRPLRAAPLW